MYYKYIWSLEVVFKIKYPSIFIGKTTILRTKNLFQTKVNDFKYFSKILKYFFGSTSLRDLTKYELKVL